MTSGTTVDPRIQQNIQLMQSRGLERDIPAYLRDIEHVNPADYTSNPSLGQQFMHGAGLIGRMGVQGIGNLASLPFGMAGAAYQGVTGNRPPALLQGNQGTAAADQMGLPQPQGAAERILTSAGENAVMSAAMPGAGPGLTALGAGAGAAGQGAAEAGAGPLGQMAASATVGMGIPVVGMMAAAAIRSAIAGSSARREAARQSMALLQAGNPSAPMTLGQVVMGESPRVPARLQGVPVIGRVEGWLRNQGGMARTVEGGLRNIPGAMGTFQRTLRDQGDAMSNRATKLADQISPAGTPTTAGAAVQRGIEQGFIPRFKAQANALYSRVFQMVPPEHPIIPTRSVALAAEQGSLAASARPLSDNIASPKIASILEDLAATVEKNPTGVQFRALKEIRSRLGAMLSGDELVADINLRDVKRLYGALSDDMRTGIAEQGDDALRAWDRAENYWKAGSARIENTLQSLMNKKEPERAFMALFSGTREGATILRSTMRSLRGDEKRLVASTVLRRLGKANPGAQDDIGAVFSPEAYLTNWNKLAPEAKGALFEGIDPMITKDLNALAKAMDLQKKAGNILPNRSGTASNTAFWSIFNGVGQGATVAGGALAGHQVAGGMGAAAGAMIGPIVTAGAAKLLAEKMFTNPRMIRWMVRQIRVPLAALTQEMAILAKDSQKWDPESRGIAEEVTQHFGNIDWKTLLTATAVADASGVR